MNASEKSCILHSILPVQVRVAGSGKPIVTYAFYDNGSSGSFITHELKEELNAFGSEIQARMKTMYGYSLLETTVVPNLIVTILENKNAVTIDKAYWMNEIPVSTDRGCVS